MKTLFIIAAMILGGNVASAKDQPPKPANPQNSEINTRDRKPGAVTADQQGMSARDTEITQKIRQAIVADSSLSTNAHNVKVITVDGHVTLKGPVNSAREKEMVEEKAKQVAGAVSVTNELDVAKSE